MISRAMVVDIVLLTRFHAFGCIDLVFRGRLRGVDASCSSQRETEVRTKKKRRN
jgi:hypothetical protein